MAVNEIPTQAALLMDRDTPLANYPSQDGRRSMGVMLNSFFSVPPTADNFTVTTTTTTDIFTFKQGTTVLKTITVSYSDSTKTQMIGGSVV